MGDEDEYDPTVEMGEDFVSAANTLPDEILFTANDVDMRHDDSEKQIAHMKEKPSPRQRKSRLTLSSIFSEDESVQVTELMEENHIPASETVEGEIEFNMDRVIHDKESQANEDDDPSNSEWAKNDSEEDWLDSIDWNETIISQGTMNELMNEDIFDEGNASVRKEVNCAPRKKTRAKDSVHYKKQKTKAFQEKDSYEMVQLS